MNDSCMIIGTVMFSYAFTLPLTLTLALTLGVTLTLVLATPGNAMYVDKRLLLLLLLLYAITLGKICTAEAGCCYVHVPSSISTALSAVFNMISEMYSVLINSP